MHEVAVTVLEGATLPVDEALLTAAEREAASALRGVRRDEWVRGRIAIHRVLGAPHASTLIDRDGAPLLVGDALGRSISLSHDGAWIAVAVARRGRVGIDLAARAHVASCTRVLAGLGVAGGGDPVATWAALEAVLKLRRRSVLELRGAALAVRDAGVRLDDARLDRWIVDGAPVAHAWIVEGIGARAAVDVASCASYAVAVAAEDDA